MKHLFKKIIAMAIVLSLSLSAVACSGGGDTAKTDLKDFDLVLDWYPNAIHSFIYEAIDKGYYEEEGLNINIRFPSNTNDAISLTAAGKADVGIYYLHYVIDAYANQDIPIKSIGAVVQEPLSVILSLKDENIKEPKDLVGKTMGASDSELNRLYIKTMLKNQGVSSDDVKVIDVGFDLMSAMTTGNVDVTLGCMVNHEVPQMEKEGFEVNYFDPSDYGVPASYELIFVTGEKQLENERETLEAFLRATKKGFEAMKSDPDGALDTLLKYQNEENFPLDRDVEEKSMEILLPAMEKENAPFLSQSEEIWQNNIDWLYNEGFIKEKIKPSDVMENLL